METHSSIIAWEMPWTDRRAWYAIVQGVAKESYLGLATKQQQNTCNGKFICPKHGLSFSKVAKTNLHKGKRF